MNDIKIIHLRPHHGICIQNFIGRGYSEEFIRNMKAVINELESNKNSIVRLVSDNDVICKCCPHNNGKCDSIGKVMGLDEACLKKSGLTPGSDIKWEKFKWILKERILMTEEFDNVCKKCEWFSLCRKIRTAHQMPI